jgi:hypothetical protein
MQRNDMNLERNGKESGKNLESPEKNDEVQIGLKKGEYQKVMAAKN